MQLYIRPSVTVSDLEMVKILYCWTTRKRLKVNMLNTRISDDTIESFNPIAARLGYTGVTGR